MNDVHAEVRSAFEWLNDHGSIFQKFYRIGMDVFFLSKVGSWCFLKERRFLIIFFHIQLGWNFHTAKIVIEIIKAFMDPIEDLLLLDFGMNSKDLCKELRVDQFYVFAIDTLIAYG